MTAGRKSARTWTGKPADGSEHTGPGAAPGTFLSDFAIPNLEGKTIRVSDQLGHPYFFLFIDANCGPSEDVLREMARLRRKPGSKLPPAIIASSGDAAAVRDLVTRYDSGPDVVRQEFNELYTFYRIPATPSAYLVDETRRTVGTLAVGKHAVIGLLRGKRNQKPGNKPGDSTPAPSRPKVRLASRDLAPEITVAAPEGYSISLTAQRGRRVLLLFWSEQCAFCDQIPRTLINVPDEIAVFVVGRDGDAKPEMGDLALFGAQERTSAFDAFGLYQMPTAVLIDPAGRLERDPVVGAKAVGALIDSLGV